MVEVKRAEVDTRLEDRKIRVKFPEEMPAAYATNLVVQHTKHEFFISFFALYPPLILGTEEDKKARLEALSEVSAQPIVKIIISANRMGEFIQVMQDNQRTYTSTHGAPADDEA